MQSLVFSKDIPIGEIIHHAVVFNPKNWLRDMMYSDSLIQAVKEFFSILQKRKIKYVLAGGVALLYYIEGRNTQDLDLIMSLPSLEKLPELKVSSQDMFFLKANYGELQIDILLTQNPLFNIIQKKYSKIARFLGQKIPIATVEGLILLKLYALPSLYRQGNFAKVGIHENDVATLIYYYKPNTESLFRELSKYVSETDLVELQGIVQEIQKRISRFRKCN